MGAPWPGMSLSTTVKVDTVAPTNSLSLGTAAHAFLNGTTLYYEGATSGSFKLVNTVSDAESGPASATFQHTLHSFESMEIHGIIPTVLSHHDRFLDVAVPWHFNIG